MTDATHQRHLDKMKNLANTFKTLAIKGDILEKVTLARHIVEISHNAKYPTDWSDQEEQYTDSIVDGWVMS